MKVVSHDFSRVFFNMYHASVFEALGENAAKYNARIGAILANAWHKRVDSSADPAESKKAKESYTVEPFSFSDIVRFEFTDEGTVYLYAKNCVSCIDNEQLLMKEVFMSHDFSKEFFAAYHAAVIEALGEDAARYNAKIGVILANAWQKRLRELPADPADFKKTIEEYMSGPFRFSDIARFEFNDDGTAHLYVKGCDICNGNEILRNSGKKGSCPISQMVKSAMGKALKTGVELTGSEKPGPVGECYLKYKISR
ncbi:MAG TPA: hypothetical protein VI728_04715 [Syntrophales bacterium]|nr:MAG: hypothetical protein A2052_03790 [Deltaproteobacteria bacterium GWA2_54_12]HLE17571.1 hypothetical protein [Syntrophales bacterium]